MRTRLQVLRIITLLVLLVLTGRLAWLQLIVDNSLRDRARQNSIRTEYILPVRGEIYASDGKTLLAASVPIFNVVVRPDTLPNDEREQQEIFAKVAAILPLTDTLVISPAMALYQRPQLANAVRQLVEHLPERPRVWRTNRPLTVTLPYSQTLAGLELSRAYSDVVKYDSHVQRVIDEANLPPYLSVPIKTEVTREVALALRENQSLLPGIQVVQGYRRGYPLSNNVQSLSHLLGYMRSISGEELEKLNPPADLLPRYLLNDVIGKAGLEASYEEELRGSLGVRQLEVDVNQVPVSEPTILQPKQDGNNLILSIDIALQRHTEATLKKWLEESDRRRRRSKPSYDPIDTGVIIAIDVNTGAILSSVSLPAYDNNVFTKQRLSQDDAKYLFQSEKTPMLNRAIHGWFPPGSTFKQVSAAAALGLDVIYPNTRLHDPGIIYLENPYAPQHPHPFPNAIRGDRGMINVVDALMNSSNVFFAQVIGGSHYVINLRKNDPRIEEGVGADRLAKIATEWFGLGQKTGIDLPGEITGFIPTSEWKEKEKREIWSVGDTYNMAIGQGDVLLTPLQILHVNATLANGGTRYKPHVVKAITTPQGELVRTIKPEVIGQMSLHPEDLEAIRLGMLRSVQDRKAHNHEVATPEQRELYEELRLAGKTGTAEYIEPDGTERSHSWFVGFAPYENPEIAVVAFLAGTGDLNDGSSTLTLPAAAEVMAAYFGMVDPVAPTRSSRR